MRVLIVEFSGPSVLPLPVGDIESGSGPLIGKAMHFGPSASSCGCFVATVTREVNAKLTCLVAE